MLMNTVGIISKPSKTTSVLVTNGFQEESKFKHITKTQCSVHIENK